MKSKALGIIFAAVGLALVGGCTSLETLPESQLSSTASGIVNKPITAISNVRSVGDMEYFDATASDGTVYSCSLQVVLGMSSQHQQCAKK
jgi:hypothetical protein